MLGGISVKTLNDLIRDRGLETTTLGYAPPSRKGGPRPPHLGDDRRPARGPHGRAESPRAGEASARRERLGAESDQGP